MRQLRPRDDEPESSSEEQTDGLHGVPPGSRWARMTAVAKKVALAARLAGEPSDRPHKPWPEVQPPAVRAPKPITAPAPSSSASCAPPSDAPPYESEGENVPLAAAKAAPPRTNPSSRKVRKPKRCEARSMYPPSAPSGLFTVARSPTMRIPNRGPATYQGHRSQVMPLLLPRRAGPPPSIPGRPRAGV